MYLRQQEIFAVGYWIIKVKVYSFVFGVCETFAYNI